MIADLLALEAPVSAPPKASEVACPGGLPCAFVRLMRVEVGGEPFVLVCTPDNALLAVLGNRLSLAMSNIVDRAKFAGPARRCKTLEGMLHCGYAVASMSDAQWLSSEVRLVLDLSPHVRRMLGSGAHV